ncbi:type VI secretion system tip protein VgrG [Morganella morganii]|uniref:type VI secretion system Vgr family protein n=1 Tax=Morganella morganii TaxID=582 RepID=UPI001645F999|nr:type VI secretion system tip protein TssI/VgrG [Morganella morganii]MBC3995483.1 type VI secretion system tip protein VgrG [Morganella morganii]
MFAEDPKKKVIDPAALKDSAAKYAEDAAASEIGKKMPESAQKAVSAVQQAQKTLAQTPSAADLIPGGGIGGGLSGAAKLPGGAGNAGNLIPGGGIGGGLSSAAKLPGGAGSLAGALTGRSPSGLVFTCKIGGLPEQTFQVTEFSLSEGLSSLFSLSISAVSALPSITFDEHLGKASSLTVTRDGTKVRTVQGVLATAEQGNTDGNKTWYHFLIRPEMWIMTLNQDSRIFQKQSVPEVLATLLDEAHVKNELKFYQDELHQKRDYITQKRESAFDFWCRLAAEEGINFWFEEGPKLFYSDNHLGMTAGINLTYNPQADTDISDSTAFSWRYAEQLCSDVIIQKDYNPDRPSYPFKHEVTGDVHKQHPVYESYGRYRDDETGKPFTQLRYEQSQNQRQTGTAGTNCFALMPGKIFTLKNHPSDSMNKAWQVIVVNHHGIQPLADNGGGEGTKFSNTVQFIPGTREWRPPYRFRPQADGDELATIVGPDGEEIYTNEQGAVKVYFHWDRYGKPDHSASCWVRVAMGWNGGGYGFSAVPRIGQEVIVSYLNGDIDRPIVTGCTYNGRNGPPSSFPGSKTQTAFRTQTHKGDGFNELRFEDENGKQEVFMHAQKDMNTVVQNDQSLTVLNDKTKNVAGNETNTIEGFENSKVVGVQDIAIKGNSSLLTGGCRRDQAAGRYLIGSGELIRLECGESVLELSASGAINLKGKSFNITVENDGEINTKQGVLGLNPDTASPAVSPDGTGNKGAITTAVNDAFSAKG